MLTSTAIESLLRFDSWGKLLSTSCSLASTLGKDNPFRYRGYVFDEETGFYYLQSRYYVPQSEGLSLRMSSSPPVRASWGITLMLIA